MKARIAYLSTPERGRYVLNIQPEGEDSCLQYEISQAHLANIIIDGTTLALRNIDNRSVPHRVPETQTRSAHERT
jgi:hypothetical protein